MFLCCSFLLNRSTIVNKIQPNDDPRSANIPNSGSRKPWPSIMLIIKIIPITNPFFGLSSNKLVMKLRTIKVIGNMKNNDVMAQPLRWAIKIFSIRVKF